MARPPRLPIIGPRRRPINANAAPEAPAPPPPSEKSEGANGKSASSGAPGLPAKPELPTETKARAPEPSQPPPPPDDGERRFWPAALGGLILIAAVAGILVSVGVIGGENEGATPAPVPIQTATVPSGDGDESAAVQAAAELGFPTFATKNTTRIGGSNPTDNAAAAALATFPTAGEGARAEAVVVADADDWPSALAAAVLTAEPVSAPILLSHTDRLPDTTERALTALDPQGGPATGGAQVFAIGGAQIPAAQRATPVAGANPAQLAAGIARLRAELTGGAPAAYVLASDAEPGFSMPAAAWAARSGDPVLFTGSGTIPKATLDLLAENPGVPVYVLGPPEVIPNATIQRLRQGGRVARRVHGPDPVTNAIAFARFGDGQFGWNINDPGHGLVVARADRPLDAAAAAPLSASGTWGPMLLTDAATGPQAELSGYLLDIKPGYRNDPTRALYNHVWIIGDQEAIDLAQQATLDQLAELERIGPEPEAPVQQPEADQAEQEPAPEDDQDAEQEPGE